MAAHQGCSREAGMACTLGRQVLLDEGLLSPPVIVGKLHTGQVVDPLCPEIEGLGPAPGVCPPSMGRFSTQLCTVEP